MNRTDLTKEIARREALASAWSASAKELRAELELAARREFEENGTGVTWTMRDLGRVTLPLTTEAPVIAGSGGWAAEGPAIPGMTSPVLTVTVDRDVKALYAKYASAVVAEELAAEPS